MKTVKELYQTRQYIKTVNPVAILYSGYDIYVYCDEDHALYQIQHTIDGYALVDVPTGDVLAYHHSSELYNANYLYTLIKNKEVTIFYSNNTQIRNKHKSLTSHNMYNEMALLSQHM